MSEMGQRSLLLLMDEWMRAMHEPVLIPDVRSVFAIVAPEQNVVTFTPTYVFHTLRDMVADGLISHTQRGYELTANGREVAEQLRTEEPEVAERAAQVVREYAVQ
jgi:hypothetical protein